MRAFIFGCLLELHGNLKGLLVTEQAADKTLMALPVSERVKRGFPNRETTDMSLG